jgi:hypothetical protein
MPPKGTYASESNQKKQFLIALTTSGIPLTLIGTVTTVRGSCHCASSASARAVMLSYPGHFQSSDQRGYDLMKPYFARYGVAPVSGLSCHVTPETEARLASLPVPVHPFPKATPKLLPPPRPKSRRLRIKAFVEVHALPRHAQFEHFPVKLPALHLQRIDMKIGCEPVLGMTGFGLSRESGPPPPWANSSLAGSAA